MRNAIDVWFDAETVDRWDAEHYRWESWDATHVIYWLPGEQPNEVRVLSCFRR
jgi:hypothetical protein